MRKLRCPKCGEAMSFDDKQVKHGQAVILTCTKCGKRFGIRIKPTAAPSPKPIEKSKAPAAKQQDEEPELPVVGTLVVIENVFHYKQELPLHMGDNIIGRYHNNPSVNCPIETTDPSIDITHCVINVSRDKRGQLRFVLRDGPSYTGTFVDNEILGDRERREITDGTLFTIGATSIILKTNDA